MDTNLPLPAYDTTGRIRLITAMVRDAEDNAKEAIVSHRIPSEGPAPDHSCVAQECFTCIATLRKKAARKTGTDMSQAEVVILRDRQDWNTPQAEREAQAAQVALYRKQVEECYRKAKVKV